MGAVSRRDKWNQRGVRRGYDQVEDVAFVVGRKVNMLRKTERGEKRKKLRGEMIVTVVLQGWGQLFAIISRSS